MGGIPVHKALALALANKKIPILQCLTKPAISVQEVGLAILQYYDFAVSNAQRHFFHLMLMLVSFAAYILNSDPVMLLFETPISMLLGTYAYRHGSAIF